MARILLAHSYVLRFDPKAWKQRRPYPPLGTLYAAAALRDAGHSVSLFDAMLADNVQALDDLLDREHPDALLLYEDSFNYLSKMCLTRMREAACEMAGMARRRGIPVAAHGSDATDHAAQYMARGVDVVLRGEGERTAVELCDALDAGGWGDAHGSLHTIPGLLLPGADGASGTGTRALLRDLDSLPFPAWDLVDMPAYRNAWRRHAMFSLNLVTTRGCPYHCNWCAKPVYGQAYTSHSPEYVAEHLGLLRARYQPDHVWYCDDILGLRPGWLERYATLVEHAGLRTPFSCQTRADLVLRDDNARHLARAGAHTVWLGAESGAQHVLDAMDKGITVQQILDATRALQALGVNVAWFLQFGYPGEDDADIASTLRMVRKGAPDDIGISVSYPLPGTVFYDRVRASLGEKQNWVDSGDLALMYPGKYPPEVYRALHAAVHREFRLRQGVRAAVQPSRWRSDARRIALAPLNAALLVAAQTRLAAVRRMARRRDSRGGAAA